MYELRLQGFFAALTSKFLEIKLRLWRTSNRNLVHPCCGVNILDFCMHILPTLFDISHQFYQRKGLINFSIRLERLTFIVHFSIFFCKKWIGNRIKTPIAAKWRQFTFEPKINRQTRTVCAKVVTRSEIKYGKITKSLENIDASSEDD